MSIEKFSLEWGGKNLEIEIGRLAGQANGSCVVRYGDTMVLATAVISRGKREGIDYFPLMVDYEERLYAAGKIKSSRFIKREGRPTDEAILTSRLIDRPLRPLFDDRVRNDVQVITAVLSIDQENDPDIPALIGASVALSISNIPWNGPIAAIRVGKIDNEWVINPTYTAREKSVLDLVVAGTPEKVLMLEASGLEVPEEVVRDAIIFGQKHLKKVIDLIKEIQQKVGQPKLDPATLAATGETEDERKERETILEQSKSFLETKYSSVLFSGPKITKAERRAALNLLKNELDGYLKDLGHGKEKRKIALDDFDGFVEEAVTRAILDDDKRVDGRGLYDVRPLSVAVAALPRIHGSAIFSRGETQVLSAITLGAPSDEQILDGMEITGKKRYMHHYNFPPYSVGETGPLRGPGRREIGHGALAEKAMLAVLPKKEDFPYTIRVVSEVLSSNGSSSMASTCGSSLALMDAGVPINSAVAGVAMGLASDQRGRYKVITDLQDLEDGAGGMDFKIAGTKNGVTAVQMDTKTAGLTPEIVEETLRRGKEARLKVLDAMNAIIAAPREDLSPYAPRIITIQINPDRIRDVIGPGGKVINEIIDKTGVTIDVENSGLVTVCSANKESLEKAVNWIKTLTKEVAVDEIYEGKVTRILDFGAFVEILPNKEGMVHISELAPYRVNRVQDVVKIGDAVKVKVIKIDELGRVNLSIKQLLPGTETGGGDEGDRERRSRQFHGPDKSRP